MLLISQQNPAGHVVIVRISEEHSAVVDFTDGSPRSVVTPWLPDLFLLGLAASHERSEVPADLAPEEEEVAKLSLEGEGEFLLFYGHPGSGQVVEVPWIEAAPYITAGIAAQITAGVAAEAAEDLPEDPSTLEV